MVDRAVDVFREELLAVEANNKLVEAEAAKFQSRLRSGLDKADKLKALIALYDDVPVEGQQQPGLFPAPMTALTPPPPPPLPLPPGEQRTSKAAALRAEITDLLGKRGTEHRQKLLDHLVAMGLMGSEKDPMASLAAYLSNNKDLFLADGRGNFSLRHSHQEPPPAPVPGAGTTGP